MGTVSSLPLKQLARYRRLDPSLLAERAEIDPPDVEAIFQRTTKVERGTKLIPVSTDVKTEIVVVLVKGDDGKVWHVPFLPRLSRVVANLLATTQLREATS